MNPHVIYQHTSPSGKSYIGQTNNYKKRNSYHKFSIREEDRLQSSPFTQAIAKYGWDSFTHRLLENNLTLDEANEREQFYIALFNTLTPNGYNVLPGGKNSTHTDETKQKMRLLATGRKHSEETIQKIKLAKQAQAKDISERMKGRVLSDETKQKIRDANLGKKYSEEHKQKLSASMKALITPELIKKRADSLKGHLTSEETRRKISLANSNPSDETRQKLSDAAKRRYKNARTKRDLEKHIKVRL